MMSIRLEFKPRPLIGLLACIFLVWAGDDARAEDLLTVYQHAAATSPVLARARSLLLADEAGGSVARSALYPKLGIGAGLSRKAVDITGFGTPVDESFWGNTYSATLTQPIVNGQDWVTIRASESQIRAGEAGVLAVEQTLILEVFRNYFGVLQAQANERVALTQRDLMKRILEQTEAFLRVGTGDIIAVREAQARLDEAESGLIRAQNRVKISKQALMRLTHGPLGPLNDVGQLQPQGPKPDVVEPWVKAAMENQPELIQAREQLQATQDQIEIARRARWPRLNLDAGYSHIKGNFLPTITDDEMRLGMVLSWPIYQGGEIKARVEQAKAQAMAGVENLTNLQDQVRLDTESAFLNLKDSVAQLHAAEKAVESSKVSMEATRKGYEVGTRSIIDLLNSVQDDAAARRNYFLSLYTQVLARVQLKGAAGVVTVKDVEAVNALLVPGSPHSEIPEVFRKGMER
jgi:outer membrane protein